MYLLMNRATVKAIFIFFAVTVLFTPSSTPAFTLTDSPPITVSHNGQVIENVRIHAVGQPGIKIQNFSDVIIRNVEINHEGGNGILCTGADGLSIENVSITHIGSGSPLPSEGEINIDCELSSGIVIKNARLRGGSSGIYLLQSPNAHLSFIEGYNFRGPFPRGQLVQFNSSSSCTLEDFSAINNPDPSDSWTEDIISVFRSDNCIIRRGLLEGNNSESGVGIMFESSVNGLVEDVDTVGQANGSFFAYPGNDVTFRRTRARDNICVSQGRGAPSSNALVWGGDPSRSTGLRIEDSRYYNLCNPGNIVWEWNTFDIVSYASEDFQPRDPIVNQFPWEATTEPTDPDPDPDPNPTEVMMSKSMAVGDIDGNGKDDVLVEFENTTGIFAWMNNSYWVEVDASSPESMAVGDIDGNGKDDVLVEFGNAEGLFAWMNNANWVQLNSISPDSMTVGDIDGNGKDDVLVNFGSLYGIHYWLNNASWHPLNGLSSESIITGDIDGNGKDDVIVDFGAFYGIHVAMNLTNWVQMNSISPDKMTVGDLDGNGKNEVLADFGSISAWTNNSYWVDVDGSKPEIMTVGDIDGNGKDDVLVEFENAEGIFVWMNNTNWIELDGSSPVSMTVGDIDGNGKDDVLVEFENAEGIFVWMNNTNWVELDSSSL